PPLLCVSPALGGASPPPPLRPPRPLLPHAGAVPLGRRDAFFLNDSPIRRRYSDRAERLTRTPRRSRNSARVASGSARTNSRSRASCAARTTGRPGLFGRGAIDPVAFCRCLSRRTHDSLTRYFAATVGVVMPAWQSATTRSRRSIEYARIGTPPQDSSVVPERIAWRYTIPETALAQA